MGCDGGTIPTRDELVKLKKKPERKDKDSERLFRWKHCTITQEPLQTPIVACELGRLYKKDSVIEFLLDKSKFEDAATHFDHLRGLKDVKELKLTDNPSYVHVEAELGNAYIDQNTSQYICPVTGLEMNGVYKFCFLWKCGCVFAERALKEVKSTTCHKCGASYASTDLIFLNGTEDDITQHIIAMEKRRIEAKLEKKAKKKKAPETATSSTEDGPSSSKQPKLDGSEAASSSKTATGSTDSSKLTIGAASSKSKLGGRSVGLGSKLPNGKPGDKQYKTIQDNPKVTKVYKSLFNTSEAAKNKIKNNWVTYNPFYN